MEIYAGTADARRFHATHKNIDNDTQALLVFLPVANPEQPRNSDRVDASLGQVAIRNVGRDRRGLVGIKVIAFPVGEIDAVMEAKHKIDEPDHQAAIDLPSSVAP